MPLILQDKQVVQISLLVAFEHFVLFLYVLHLFLPPHYLEKPRGCQVEKCETEKATAVRERSNCCGVIVLTRQFSTPCAFHKDYKSPGTTRK